MNAVIKIYSVTRGARQSFEKPAPIPKLQGAWHVPALLLQNLGLGVWNRACDAVRMEAVLCGAVQSPQR